MFRIPLKRAVFNFVLTFIVAMSCSCLDAIGQDANAETEKKPPVKPDPAKIDPVLNRIEGLNQRVKSLEEQLLRLQVDRGQAAAQADRGILTLLESPSLSRSFHTSAGRMRCFITRVTFVNLTKEAIEIVPVKQITLEADGNDYALKALPRQLEYQSISMGGTSFQLGKLAAAKKLQIPVGGSGSTYLVFIDLPLSNHVPRMKIKVETNAKKWDVDVNERERGRLGLAVDRIGPHDSLALLTVSGELNTINIRDLVETLDQISLVKVGRVVIRFGDSAAPLDRQLSDWIKQSTIISDGNRRTNAQFPSVPISIRELHVSRIPDASSRSSSSRRQTGMRVHETDIAAISAALTSAYETIPRDDLIRELKQGDQLTRAAAIAGGGGRLLEEHLPMLLQFADDDDIQVQQATLVSLRHFGNPEVISKLVHFMRTGKEPLASTAVESLAASRFPNAHKELLKLIREETAVSRKKILFILAEYPRPIWRDTIYEFANNFEAGTVAEAIEALIQIGHPQLLDVLSQALEKGDNNLKKKVFSIVAARSDPESEKIATEYVLENLEKTTPNHMMFQSMLNFITKTKEQRAIPLLLTHLRRPSSQRSTLINTLAQIGDQTVAAALVDLYPQLTDSDKARTLTVLQQMRSPQFRELARSALQTSNSSLISAACSGLQNDASQEAVQILTEALKTSQFSTTWSRVCNALSKLATSEARDALKQARDSDIPQKSVYATNALRTLRQSSPGYSHYTQGRQKEAQQKWKEAIDHHTLAIKIDGELVEAYLARANVYLRIKNYALAMPDFKQALKLEPTSTDGITGTAICSVIEGEIEEGIRLVESADEKTKNDGTFAYNTACVYSRALEYVKREKDYANRDVLIKKYAQLALDALQRSVDRKFKDFSWMREDPDLVPLHDIPRFRTISKMENEKGKEKKPEKDEPKEE